jgi:prolyl-tRNA synthetase
LGGSFNHGHHIHQNDKDKQSKKLGSVYVSIMNKLGMDAERFSNGHGSMGEVFC